MKQFLKFTLATIVGIIITTFLGIILFMGFIGIVASSTDKVVKLKPNSVYRLELNGNLVERSQDNPFSGFFVTPFGRAKEKSIGLDDVLANIEKAKNNDNIKGIYLEAGALSAGYASVKEIRDALEDFKKSGKFIVAYADVYTQKMYYLCSVADKMLLNPQGMIDFQGLSSQTMFFKKALDKLGVEMQVVKVGTFKSAVEPFIMDKMSDANKEQVTVFANSIWKNLLNEISVSRKISIDSLNTLADQMMLFQPVDKALKAKMIDSLVYVDGVDSVINNEYLKQDRDESIYYVSNSELVKVSSNKKLEKEKVAVIYAFGGIDMDGGEDGIVSQDLVKTINDVRQEKTIKAVVFRVNSPGGSAYGSEQILNAIKQLKKEKPVIVSMGDYAASGGYYISCAADTIIAQPNTLTGSIGIFGIIPNVKGLYDKLGLSTDGIKTNKMSDAISVTRPFTPEERNLMQSYVNRGYELFVSRCAEGRGKTPDQIKAIAEGRVWTGEDAMKLGLVDKLGTINDAIALAAKKANLTQYNVKTYPEKEDFFTRFIKEFEDASEIRIVKKQLGENYFILQQIKQAQKMNGIYALMPFDVTFN
ncbi:Signal peptide peptidase A [uncultured Paludibacter sp.]|uniref:Signal peptide peptidase A n=1 Tax=uncultured Paludibacter sp. TaxID=497635 RepID=A0A653AFS5_9BACT|nr:Signal peptide peptidase A [uncultured Paludibacter sp.]